MLPNPPIAVENFKLLISYQREGDDEAEQLECLLVGAQQPHPGDHPDMFILSTLLLRDGRC